MICIIFVCQSGIITENMLSLISDIMVLRTSLQMYIYHRKTLSESVLFLLYTAEG